MLPNLTGQEAWFTLIFHEETVRADWKDNSLFDEGGATRPWRSLFLRQE